MIRISRTILCLTLTGVAAPLVSQDVPTGSHQSSPDYVEVAHGTLPIVLCAPHGGRLKPDSLPDRSKGVLQMDANTQELARAVAGEFEAGTDETAHLVVSLLHRRKLDPNREILEAAQGHPLAEATWKAYHEAIEQACQAAVVQHGFAFLVDLHGHAHPQARVELGYLHGIPDLTRISDPEVANELAASGSLQLVADRSKVSYRALITGPRSLGGLLEERGFHSTPSPRLVVPDPPFFRGGYTIRRHCVASNGVAGAQVELYRPNLRDTARNRQRFAEAMADSILQFLATHLDFKPTP